MTKLLNEADISSSTNAKFKTWKALLSSQGIRKGGLFIVSGEKILAELTKTELKIESWLIRKSDAEKDFWVLPADLDRRMKFILTNELFDELNELNVPGPLAVVSRPEHDEADLSKPPKGLEIILALQDPSNLGASLRVAEAFNASKVILLKECAEPFLPKTSRTASGSNFRVNIQKGPSIKDLRPVLAGPVVVLDMDGQDIAKLNWPKDVRLFLGVEGPGVPAELKSQRDFIQAKININSAVDSLNAMSALSIACFSYQSKK
ncbi:MAG: TrmH family RNA methyltransferase [Bdellovibrionota bacterium]